MTKLEQEKLKIKVEHMAKIINKFSDEEYDAFMTDLQDTISNLENKIERKQDKLKILEKKPKERDLHGISLAATITLSELGTAFAVTAIPYYLTGHEGWLFFGPILGLINGLLTTAINCKAYEEKTFTGIFDKLRLSRANKKLDKIKGKNDACSYLRQLIARDEALEK